MDVKSSCAKLPPDLFAVLIKYISLHDILSKILWLNREIHDVVRSENYTLFKHFVKLFCINRW